MNSSSRRIRLSGLSSDPASTSCGSTVHDKQQQWPDLVLFGAKRCALPLALETELLSYLGVSDLAALFFVCRSTRTRVIQHLNVSLRVLDWSEAKTRDDLKLVSSFCQNLRCITEGQKQMQLFFLFHNPATHASAQRWLQELMRCNRRTLRQIQSPSGMLLPRIIAEAALCPELESLDLSTGFGEHVGLSTVRLLSSRALQRLTLKNLPKLQALRLGGRVVSDVFCLLGQGFPLTDLELGPVSSSRLSDLGQLVSASSASGLESLHLQIRVDSDRYFDDLAAFGQTLSALPYLKDLSLDISGAPRHGLGCAIWSLPHVESLQLDVTDGPECLGFHAPNVEWITMWGGDLNHLVSFALSCERLVAMRLCTVRTDAPALERLQTALRAGKKWPKLATLRLEFPTGPSILQALVERPRPLLKHIWLYSHLAQQHLPLLTSLLREHPLLLTAVCHVKVSDSNDSTNRSSSSALTGQTAISQVTHILPAASSSPAPQRPEDAPQMHISTAAAAAESLSLSLDPDDSLQTAIVPESWDDAAIACSSSALALALVPASTLLKSSNEPGVAQAIGHNSERATLHHLHSLTLSWASDAFFMGSLFPKLTRLYLTPEHAQISSLDVLIDACPAVHDLWIQDISVRCGSPCKTWASVQELYIRRPFLASSTTHRSDDGHGHGHGGEHSDIGTGAGNGTGAGADTDDIHHIFASLPNLRILHVGCNHASDCFAWLSAVIKAADCGHLALLLDIKISGCALTPPVDLLKRFLLSVPKLVSFRHSFVLGQDKRDDIDIWLREHGKSHLQTCYWQIDAP